MSTKYKKLSVRDLLHQQLARADHIILMGLQASGKSTLAHAILAAGNYVRLNGDDIREELLHDATSHDNEELVYETLRSRLQQALDGGKRTLIDMTNLTVKGRARLLDIYKTSHKKLHYVLLDVVLETCRWRNQGRERKVPIGVMISASRALRVNGMPDLSDGSKLTVLRPSDEMGHYLLMPKGEIPDVMRQGGEPLLGSEFDIIGDVHGCYDELLALLTKLGYQIEFDEPQADRPVVIKSFTPPRRGRKLVFVGDLMDRGPRSDLVIALVMALRHRLVADVVTGNHCNKMMRVLKGNPIEMKPALQESLAQVKQHGDGFTQAVCNFLMGLPTRLENRSLIVVHAAYRKGINLQHAEKLAMIGEVDGSRDAQGFPIRLENWEREYSGRKTIVHGHVPVANVVDRTYPGGRVVNIDTGCCFGGKLTALRFPEMEYVSVSAARAYSPWHGALSDK